MIRLAEYDKLLLLKVSFAMLSTSSRLGRTIPESHKPSLLITTALLSFQ